MEDSDPTHGDAAARARADDLSWFQSYPHRKFRVRDAKPFEFGAPFNPGLGMRRLVIVRHEGSDLTSAPISQAWDAPMPEDDDGELEKLFKQQSSRSLSI
jgi:hypothetical protein